MMSLFKKLLDKDRVFGKVENCPPLCQGQNCIYIAGIILDIPDRGGLFLCRDHGEKTVKALRKAGLNIPKADWETEYPFSC